MKKVKKEELEKLQQLNSEFVQAKTQLGDLEIQKSMIISNVQEIRSQFGELEQTLMKKYGENSVINLQTGEIKEKE
jgi:predicted  nucleic acid-binding Zn-ribbon protein|tara:strand:+ start:640 stop:867 length:228 start_codon:yes stop_codon:yes gene_type:complete